MKATDNFTTIIKEYLDNRAESDSLFAEKYANSEKNIDDCITYIINTVKDSGRNGFADEEIFSMAVHYYDEDDIQVGERVKARVVTNREVELTDEEKDKIRQDAIQQYHEKVLEEMKEKQSRKAKRRVETDVEQQSLF